MEISIGNISKGPFGKVLAFFDVVCDETIVLKGFALKLKNDGSKHYYQAPAKQRFKDGEPVKKDGYDVWDAHVDMYMVEGDDGKFAPTEKAWEFRAKVIELAVAAYEAAEAPSGRGAKAKPAKAKAKAAATATTTEDGNDDEEDDDLPF